MRLEGPVERTEVVKLRECVVRSCNRTLLNVLGEWPEYPVDELLNALDECRNKLIAGNVVLDDPGEVDVELEGLDGPEGLLEDDAGDDDDSDIEDDRPDSLRHGD
jgi:hypothetical protein